jgi:UDP-N-acetylmuramoyl-tripeptide--D-alanyl-D-alanine ligase
MKPILLTEIKNVLHGELKTDVQKGLVSGVCTDSRQIEQGCLFVALRGKNYDGHDYIVDAAKAGAKAILIDRNLPVPDELKTGDVCVLKVDDTLAALGDLARFYRKSLGHGVSVVAVTGSNGKTTTREIIHHVLSKKRRGHRSPRNYNNAVGVPLSIFGIEPDHDFAVLEVATNAPGEIANLSRIAQPDIAVITGIAPSHLEGLNNVDGVCQEKAAIVTGLAERGVVICGSDYPPLLEKLKPLGSPIIRFGVDVDADIMATNVERTDSGIRFATNDRCTISLPITGMCNVKNALAALAVVRRMGMTSGEFADAIADFTAVPQRMSVHHVNGITIIDDTYNANPASMAAAMEELEIYAKARRRVFICGDMNELGEASNEFHEALGRKIAASSIDLLLATGPQAALTANTALKQGMGQSAVQKSISSKRLARLVKSLIMDEDVIMVKGSRSMEMEKVVDSLKRYRGTRPIVHRPIRTTPASSKRAGRQKTEIK